jgi:hypothetical protein
MPGKPTNKNKLVIPVKKDMPDYSNDPCFVKKAERAEANLKKYGLPKDFQNQIQKKGK